MKKVLILGGDGFCGWPTALHLSARGYEVEIIDNLSRRAIDEELGIESLTPIRSIEERLAAWTEVSGNVIGFTNLDLANDYNALCEYLAGSKPDAIVHFAEQRAAPYSMKSDETKRYTVSNNINATHNLLCALASLQLDVHLVHLGTMGVYGYGSAGLKIPEGYLNISVDTESGSRVSREILYPTEPGSVYHMTKSMDQLMFQFYSRNDRIRITDLHQGIVWGTHTEETASDPRLINRFDYDGDYGTVLNRFVVEAAVGHPLTVHGTGGQTRAFIHIRDTVRCIELAIEQAPDSSRVRILNQMTETHRIADLAKLISEVYGAPVQFVVNPRNESEHNDLHVENGCVLDLGLEPTLLRNGLLDEIIEIAIRFKDRCDHEKIACNSFWNQERLDASIHPSKAAKIA